jgi:hypothetical protein
MDDGADDVVVVVDEEGEESMPRSTGRKRSRGRRD